MKMKNKAFVFTLCSILLFSTSACGKKESSVSDTATKVNEQEGLITNVSDSSFSIDYQGKQYDFITDENTVDATSDTGMAQNDYVNVIYIKKNQQLLATDVSYKERTAQGKLSKIKEDHFVLTDENNNSDTYYYNSNTVINLEDQKLDKGDLVTLSYTSNANGNFATSINSKQEDTESTSEN